MEIHEHQGDLCLFLKSQLEIQFKKLLPTHYLHEAYKDGSFDIRHDHTIDYGIPFARSPRDVITLHTLITDDREKLIRDFHLPTYVPISKSQVAGYNPRLPVTQPIYNGIDVDQFPFGEKPDSDAYLLFVGRIDRIKGVHIAIDVAHKAGMPLRIAAKRDKSEEAQAYYDKEIKPHIDGIWVRELGELNEKERNEQMRKATAVLHPNIWREPFGLVVVEAGACGAPVIGSRNGALPELIEHGKTGFVFDKSDDMVNAIKNDIYTIDRRACREHVIANFSAKRMADEYIKLYCRLVENNTPQVRYF